MGKTEYQKEQDEVFHHLADDDRPRPEKMVERQKVHQLSEAEKHGEGVELVARVHQQKASVVVEQKGNHVHKHPNCANGNYHHLYSTQYIIQYWLMNSSTNEIYRYVDR